MQALKKVCVVDACARLFVVSAAEGVMIDLRISAGLQMHAAKGYIIALLDSIIPFGRIVYGTDSKVPLVLRADSPLAFSTTGT